MELTYENIKSLIVSQEEDGMMIKLKFKAENQDTPLETVAVVTPNQDEIMKNAMKQAGKGAALSAGTNMAAGALGNMIGGVGGDLTRAAGSVAGSAAAQSQMGMNKIMGNSTDEQKQAAIVQAFSYFQMYYEWDGIKWKYVTPGA
jgi:hypothetical protein